MVNNPIHAETLSQTKYKIMAMNYSNNNNTENNVSRDKTQFNPWSLNVL